MPEEDAVADAVAQLVDLARDIFGTPVAVLTRTARGHGATDPALDQVSTVLDAEATARLLDGAAPGTDAPTVDVVGPDGAVWGRLHGIAEEVPDPLTARQLEALHVAAALLAGVLHHR